MQDVTAEFLRAVRTGFTLVREVQAWRGGRLLHPGVELPVTGGSVTVDSGSAVRRKLSCTIAPRTQSGQDGSLDLWDLLSPIGTTLTVRVGIRYPDGRTAMVPVGTFDIDEQTLGIGPGGDLAVTAPDRWVAVQRARFLTPAASQRGATLLQEMTRLLSGVPGLPRPRVEAPVRVPLVRSLAWDRDRDAAILGLARDCGVEVFIAADGVPVIRPVPTLSQAPVWTVDAGQSGVLIGGQRTRSRQRTFNAVVVRPDGLDGSAPVTPVIVQDTDPRSPTQVTGPMGLVPAFHSSPAITSAWQAQSTALMPAAASLSRSRS